jgi:hypothetical protein
MARSSIIAIACLALAGCATAPTPGIQARTVYVDKPVPVVVACVDQKLIPAEPALIGTPPKDARQAADLLGSVDLQLRHYGHQLMALINPCTK